MIKSPITIFDIETTGLDPYDSHLVTIQVKRGDSITIWKRWEMSELEMIDCSISFLKTIPPSETILGYNNLKFDIPFIVGRLYTLRGLDDCTWRLFYSKNWIDLYQRLGANYQSMETWLNKLGLQKSGSGVKGKQIPELYKNKEYKKIERYITDELHMCETLFLQLV
ncbi:MAG: ribonuclease H-like domain-containing protein [Thaumarchaeota archaeon]|nr:ribonuclease H-like domain-containing protein [Nitrososphaerota archaeon]